jgi:hypothetical protein
MAFGHLEQTGEKSEREEAPLIPQAFMAGIRGHQFHVLGTNFVQQIELLLLSRSGV